MRTTTTTATALVSILCAAALLSLLHSPAQGDPYSRYMVERVDLDDFADLRDVAVADATTITYVAARAVTINRAPTVRVCPRFAGSSDTCTIRLAFFNADGVLTRVGEAQDYTVSTETSTDSAGLYFCDEGTDGWDTDGAKYAQPVVTAVSGTVTIWAGTGR